MSSCKSCVNLPGSPIFGHVDGCRPATTNQGHHLLEYRESIEMRVVWNADTSSWIQRSLYIQRASGTRQGDMTDDRLGSEARAAVIAGGVASGQLCPDARYSGMRIHRRGQKVPSVYNACQWQGWMTVPGAGERREITKASYPDVHNSHTAPQAWRGMT